MISKHINGINTGFYIAVITSFLSVFGTIGYAYLTNQTLPYGIALVVGYINIYFLIPVISILFFILLGYSLSKFGFAGGIKEISLNSFSVMLGLLLIKVLLIQVHEKGNRIDVQFVNRTDYGRILGRNARTDLDTLAPQMDSTIIFKGRDINYETANDFENEVRIIYYVNNEWKEKYILKDFSRWMVFNGPFRIEFHNSDSISFSYQ